MGSKLPLHAMKRGDLFVLATQVLSCTYSRTNIASRNPIQGSIVYRVEVPDFNLKEDNEQQMSLDYHPRSTNLLADTVRSSSILAAAGRSKESHHLRCAPVYLVAIITGDSSGK